MHTHAGRDRCYYCAVYVCGPYAHVRLLTEYYLSDDEGVLITWKMLGVKSIVAFLLCC